MESLKSTLDEPTVFYQEDRSNRNNEKYRETVDKLNKYRRKLKKYISRHKDMEDEIRSLRTENRGFSK